MSRLVDLLQELGFSEYESRAYVALLAKSPLTGYQVAKASKVPRANVYAVLQKLEDRGAVLRVDTSAGLRYAPVAPEELTRRLGSRFERALSAARTAMAEASKPREAEFVWNAR
ncbi:MAG: TrmB family transcriptional regulator, partial [Gemmatimonadota bacterium]